MVMQKMSFEMVMQKMKVEKMMLQHNYRCYFALAPFVFICCYFVRMHCYAVRRKFGQAYNLSC